MVPRPGAHPGLSPPLSSSRWWVRRSKAPAPFSKRRRQRLPLPGKFSLDTSQRCRVVVTLMGHCPIQWDTDKQPTAQRLGDKCHHIVNVIKCQKIVNRPIPLGVLCHTGSEVGNALLRLQRRRNAWTGPSPPRGRAVAAGRSVHDVVALIRVHDVLTFVN